MALCPVKRRIGNISGFLFDGAWKKINSDLLR
jgi:hypothetical protein